MRNTKSKTMDGNKTHYPRRLTSGSACETCRRRKTKCDGGEPCNFCSTNNIKCIHRLNSKRKSHAAPVTVLDLKLELPIYRNRNNTGATINTTGTSCSSSTSSSSTTTHRSSLSSESKYHISEPLLSTYTTKKPNIFNYEYRIPSITDQLSCHTFTLETAYTL